MAESKASARASSKAAPNFVEVNGEMVEFTKAGNVSRMRAHRGNKPAIPQTHLCHLCPAKFTRITHLHRHLRTHTNERFHECDRCYTQFTRSDLLTRHKRSCGDPNNANRSRRKSCQACAEGKTKCDLQQPCSRCKARERECVYVRISAAKVQRSPTSPTDVPSPANSSTQKTKSLIRRESTATQPPSGTSPGARATIGPSTIPSSSSAPQLYHSPQNITPTFSTPHVPFGPSHTFHDYRDIDERSSSYASSVFSENTENIAQPGPTGVYGGSFAQDALEVNNQLNALFSTELFDKFFRDALEGSPVQSVDGIGDMPDVRDVLTTSSAQFPFATDTTECQPFMASAPPPELDMYSLPTEFYASARISDTTTFPPASHGIPSVMPRIPNPAVEPSIIPYPSEFQQYIHLFYNMFLAQMPIMHLGTFTVDGKPEILISAMQACGALYVKTQAAARFMDSTLASARDQLVSEFAKAPTRPEDQVHLILAVILLQTIGLFHQRPEQRAHSSIYHGMLVMMIRQSELIERVANWVPSLVDDEVSWREWACHETTKRAITLSYLHDCCHCIYFTLRPAFLRDEVTIPLPCDESLWRATTCQEWRLALRSQSAYGSRRDDRFRPPGLQVALARLSDYTTDIDPSPPLLVTPFAHFVLAHAILRKLFEDCLDKRLLDPQAEGFSIQLMLHNWLQSWLRSPETPDYGQGEPIFLHDALPFYWIAQVTLLAYQENLPPFATSAGASGENALGEAKFRLLKEWLKHIRSFLCRGQQGPTLFWDELTKIRMKGQTQSGYHSDVGSTGEASDSSRGLLGFFAGDA